MLTTFIWLGEQLPTHRSDILRNNCEHAAERLVDAIFRNTPHESMPMKATTWWFLATITVIPALLYPIYFAYQYAAGAPGRSVKDPRQRRPREAPLAEKMWAKPPRTEPLSLLIPDE
jgi:hypothetical protein